MKKIKFDSNNETSCPIPNGQDGRSQRIMENKKIDLKNKKLKRELFFLFNITTSLINDMKIALINIDRLCSTGKMKNGEFCIYNDFDVVALPEVSFNNCPVIEKCYKVEYNAGPTRNDTALLYKEHLTIKKVIKEPDGRIISG